jgi:hypothetical protein
VANYPASACHAATAVRCHWHVENALHYTRDVTFQEDQSRIRHKPGVFARLRSFAYNILRRNRSSTFSQDRYAAALAGAEALLNWNFSVAVGNRVAPAPPHRSRRAAFPHRAPIEGRT